MAPRILYILGATENKREVDHYIMASCCVTKPAPQIDSGESKTSQAPETRNLKNP